MTCNNKTTCACDGTCSNCVTKEIVGSYSFIPYPSPNQGWECPKCKVVHAPTVSSCYCQANYKLTNCLGGHIGG